MSPQKKMQKYLYKARAIALRGSIRKPYFQELGDHLAIETYAGSSCRIQTGNASFAIGKELSYESARTEIVAAEQNGVYTSTLTAQVFGLKAMQLTADEVTCRLQSVYDSNQYPQNCYPRITAAGSTIRNLRIGGELQKLDLSAFEREGGEPGFFPEPIYVKGFGTVFYAEWAWVHPDEKHQQYLTMLRLAMGSDCGGAVCVGNGTSDGYGWPPNAS